MRIVLDCRYLEKSGIGTYTKGLIDNLVCDNRNEYIFYGKSDVIRKYYGNVSIIESSHSPFSIKGLFSGAREINKYDAFYTPNFLFPIGLKKDIFSTIHDVAFFDMKEASKNFFDRSIKKVLLRRCAKKSKLIFTVSKFSEERIKHWLPVAAPKIVVTYTGLSNDILSFKRSDVKKNQIVYVGNLKRTKNVVTLLEAFASVHEVDKNMKLYIVGDKTSTYSKEIFSHINDENVEFTGKLANNEVFSLISESKFLVSPSLYEGFGLLPYEALFLGTKPIISEIPVYKEIYGNQDVIFFKDKGDLINKILNSSSQSSFVPSDLYSFKHVSEVVRERMCENADKQN